MTESIALPNASGPVSLDYIAFEREPARVWVPVGDSASVDVFDITSRTFHEVAGFQRFEREAHGRKRWLGPSAVSLGKGFAYIGDRGSSQVCPVDVRTLKLARCVELPTPTDGVAFVSTLDEVWVTTPKDHSLSVLDAKNPDTLRRKLTIRTDGAPEGYAVDETHGRFYTNLEDKNQTLVIDLKSHSIRATWPTGCDADGPRGLALDIQRELVFVACTNGVQILDAHAGAVLARVEAGAGVDNIDYLEAKKLLYVAAGKAAKLSVAAIGERGQPTLVATRETAVGARNAVADADGNAYVADPNGARLLVLRGLDPTPRGN